MSGDATRAEHRRAERRATTRNITKRCHDFSPRLLFREVKERKRAHLVFTPLIGIGLSTTHDICAGSSFRHRSRAPWAHRPRQSRTSPIVSYDGSTLIGRRYCALFALCATITTPAPSAQSSRARVERAQKARKRSAIFSTTCRNSRLGLEPRAPACTVPTTTREMTIARVPTKQHHAQVL